MLNELYLAIIYFLKISFTTGAILIINPLAITMFMLMAYFGIYKEEKYDWNGNLTNSFALIFVSISLFQYIYNINNSGAFNFIEHGVKTLVVLGLLSIGLVLVRFNFEHILPINIARYLSSPLTVNLGTYALILLVYSEIKIGIIEILALLIIVLSLMIVLLLIKFFMKKFSIYAEKQKIKERKASIKEEKYEIDELKKELKERERELEKIKIKELEKQKKEAVKLEKIIKK
jgi:cell division protein FtsL